MMHSEIKTFIQKSNESCRCRLNADLNLILSTVLINGRAQEKEFEDMCKFCQDKGIGLYVSYAKPVGSATDHPEFVITKKM